MTSGARDDEVEEGASSLNGGVESGGGGGYIGDEGFSGEFSVAFMKDFNQTKVVQGIDLCAYSITSKAVKRTS